MHIHYHYKLRPGLRIVRTASGYNIWDDWAEDAIFYQCCPGLSVLLDCIAGDPTLTYTA